MRARLATLILALVMLLPMAAGASSGEFTRSDSGTPILEGFTQYEPYKYGMVGDFFVVEFPDGTQQSTHVPDDAVGWTLFEDGSVAFELGEPEAYEQPDDSTYDFGPRPEPEPEPVPDTEPETRLPGTTSADVRPI